MMFKNLNTNCHSEYYEESVYTNEYVYRFFGQSPQQHVFTAFRMTLAWSL